MNKSKHMKEQEKRHKSLETNLTEGLQLFSWTNISLQVNATVLLFECSVALLFFFNFCCDLEKEKKINVNMLEFSLVLISVQVPGTK